MSRGLDFFLNINYNLSIIKRITVWNSCIWNVEYRRLYWLLGGGGSHGLGRWWASISLQNIINDLFIIIYLF